jgi:hypothetical protein
MEEAVDQTTATTSTALFAADQMEEAVDQNIRKRDKAK